MFYFFSYVKVKSLFTKIIEKKMIDDNIIFDVIQIFPNIIVT